MVDLGDYISEIARGRFEHLGRDKERLHDAVWHSGVKWTVPSPCPSPRSQQHHREVRANGTFAGLLNASNARSGYVGCCREPNCTNWPVERCMYKELRTVETIRLSDLFLGQGSRRPADGLHVMSANT